MKRMKGSSQLEVLTAAARGIVFPKHDNAFTIFKNQFVELVRANFGYHAAKTMTYDEDGTFSWSEGKFVCMVGATRIMAECSFEIDPTKSLTEEFARVAKERAQFDEENIVAGRALLATGRGSF